MSREDILAALALLDPNREVEWMIDLGADLTICARGGYPFKEDPGNITYLIGFNELQHQIYGRIRHLRRGDEWTKQSFIDGLIQKAGFFGITNDLGWALKNSLKIK